MGIWFDIVGAPGREGAADFVPTKRLRGFVALGGMVAARRLGADVRSEHCDAVYASKRLASSFCVHSLRPFILPPPCPPEMATAQCAGPAGLTASSPFRALTMGLPLRCGGSTQALRMHIVDTVP
jgi:hypothetical protein